MAKNLQCVTEKLTAQMLINQFPSLWALHSTLVQYYVGFLKEKYLQTVHTQSSPWITVSTIGCQHGKVKMYDSIDNA